MLDILDRELNVGDVIVYGDKANRSYQCFTSSRLGIVKKLLEPRDRNIKLHGGVLHKITTVEKVVFYPIYNNGIGYQLRTSKANKKIPQYYLTTTCLKINVEDLSSTWREIYDKVIKELKIC